ncbi:MAG: translation initiation factor [Bacteroidetes bacterium]|jgi:translation initiation factor 1|nr:translation initiation factor [Bacteroidota bacterium]
MGKKKSKDKSDKKVVFTTHPETMEDLFKGIQTGEIETPAPKEQRIRVGIEKKGRAGKTVTIIYGLEISEDGAESLMKDLKKKCGVGGTREETEILLQGDVRKAVVKELKKRGYADTKMSGG